MGYSRRFCPPRSGTTAKFVPSGDQSAHCTPSRISRGAAPPSGTRASVPLLTKGSILRLPSSTAISPEADIESTSAFCSPKGRDSGLSGRVENSSTGLSSQAALYKTVLPSGANRAMRIDRKSTRLNSSHLVISYADFCLKKKALDDRRRLGP